MVKSKEGFYWKYLILSTIPCQLVLTCTTAVVGGCLILDMVIMIGEECRIFEGRWIFEDVIWVLIYFFSCLS